VALGKMALVVPKKDFEPFLADVFTVIEKEVTPPKGVAPRQLMTLEVLTCIKMMLRVYGEAFDQRLDIVNFINDIFYAGFNKQLIETLAELAKICGGKFKQMTQIKLLNAISIILVQKTSYFPMGIELIKRIPSQNSMESHSMSAAMLPSSPRAEGVGSSPRKDTGLSSERRESMDSGLGEDSKTNYVDMNSKMDNQTMKRLMDKGNREFLLAQALGANSADPQIQSSQKTELVTLALKTLANYDFAEFADSITHFIENSVLNFLDYENP